MRCYECGGEYRTKPEEDWHIYTHLQQMWPDRDYSEQIARASKQVTLERAQCAIGKESTES